MTLTESPFRRIRMFKTTGCLLLVLSAVFPVQSSFCQDSIPEKKVLHNTVRVNLTNPMLFGDQCWIIGYERTFHNNQSFSVNAGRFTFPRLIDFSTDSIEDITKSYKTRGMSFSGDYRFYLHKLNKYDAPRGVYIGPYFSFNRLNRDFNLDVNTAALTGQVDLDLTFQVITLGVQLGYQFVFWNRLTLDMILIGPGISGYKLAADLSTTFDPEEEAALFEKINEKLQEKIPGYSLVIEPGEFAKTGSVKTTSLGFRYVIMLGFRF
jgi:hypothetical protein